MDTQRPAMHPTAPCTSSMGRDSLGPLRPYSRRGGMLANPAAFAVLGPYFTVISKAIAK